MDKITALAIMGLYSMAVIALSLYRNRDNLGRGWEMLGRAWEEAGREEETV